LGHCPSAALVDLRLPDAHGVEAIVALRIYGVPLIVLSAISTSENLEKAAEAGADDYLIKGKIDGAQIIRRAQFVWPPKACSGECGFCLIAPF